MTTSSPGSHSASSAAAIASVAPVVTSTSPSGSSSMPWKRRWCSAIAARSSGMPGPGGYWLRPSRIACDGRLEHLGRPVGVGEALAEVDRAGARGERRHLGEDRRAEAGEPARQAARRHGAARLAGSRRSSSSRTLRRTSSNDSSRSRSTGSTCASSCRVDLVADHREHVRHAAEQRARVCTSSSATSPGQEPPRVARAAPRAAPVGRVARACCSAGRASGRPRRAA